jgi:predicted RND superfamily exporter protein
MPARFKNLSQQIVNLKWAVLLITAIITVFFGYQASGLTINADILESLPDNDNNARLLKEIGSDFGGNSIGIIILETDNIYETDVIQHISDLTDSIGTIEGIASVQSMTNIINIKGDENGIEVGKLIDPYDLPDSRGDFDRLRANIANNPLYRGSIVSEDETSALIIFYLKDKAEVKSVANAIIDKADSLELPETLYYAGSPMLVSYITDLMRNDLVTLLPIAFLVIALILFFSFRSWSGVVLPLATSVIAIIWTLGSIALLGYNMSMISNNIPIILLAVGSAYAIHVVNKINIERGSNNPDSVAGGLQAVTTPVILAAITTAIGFVSFVFGAYLDMIVEFGIFTSLGTLYSCVLALTFVPAVLALGSKPHHSAKPTGQPEDRLIEKLISKIASLTLHHPKRILIFWLLMILLGILGIFSIERSVNIQEYFRPGNPARKAEQIMIDKFGGTNPVFMLFKGDILNPEVLQEMEAAANYMEKSPDINTTLSLADLIAELNYAITGSRSIPDDSEKIQQLWFLLEGNETLERMVNPDLTQAIVISKFKSPDNESKKVFADYMEAYIAKNKSADYQIEITGMPFVDITMDRSLINSQIGSILIALVFVIIVIGFVLKSFKYGLLATVPIVTAIAILFGIMGLTGISLNIATVLVASVALGIGIDYSIHIISHFNHLRATHDKIESVVSQSILTSGRAIIINFVAVSSGFLVLVFSDMIPLVYFGVLIAVSMISSGLAALTLLPSILLLIHKKAS